MDTEQTILLGIIQGLTEFLPISSSGHLVIFQHLIGLKNPELLLDISLHVGTLLAVLIFFWADIKMMIYESIGLIGNLFQKQNPSSKTQQFPHAALIVWIITGTIPTALIGILFSSFFQKMFGSPFFVGFMLIVTGAILGASRLIPDHFTKKGHVGLMLSIAVGIAQGAAIIPGISRSGATIVCGLFCGLNRELAGRFSFLLSIPAIIGATMVKFDMTKITEIGFMPFFAGIFISFLVGLIALKITMNMVRKGNLHYFSPYCLLAGIVAIFIA
ncbi:MAG TPA: undecaprenyl-diphosphate phosphatase [Desulfatiglandales bacterium]|nr:undecaprenyl-diphosphate phosphatase [Desulfatiglandales bacterium]